MTREQYARVKRVFIQATGLPESERAAFLEESCRDAPEVRREVESLLRFDKPDDGEGKQR